MELTSPKISQYRMKFFFLASTTALSFAIFKQALFPNFHLTMLLVLAIALDFVSGIMKSIALETPVISRKLRRTVQKSTMYGMMIMLSYIFRSVSEGHNMFTDLFGMIINNGVITFLIYIEAVSVLENIILMDTESTVSRVVKPVHLLLTWKLKSAMLELLGKEYDKEHKNDKTNKQS